jgi:hypothetical protein
MERKRKRKKRKWARARNMNRKSIKIPSLLVKSEF